MRYLLLLLPLLSSCASSPRSEAPRVSDTDRIIQELCGKQMALLGEDSYHGSARTVAFKVELTRRLVEECQFDAFFIETGTYDFLRIQSLLKAGQSVSDDMLVAAIGGMWASPEMAPLIPFLSGRLRAGSLAVGGIDDQLNRGTWAQNEMARELIPLFNSSGQAECGVKLERHLAWRYDDAHPYTAETANVLLGCLKDWESALSRPGTPATLEQLQMARNLVRNFTREAAVRARALEQPDGPRDWSNENARDRSMFMNLEWLLSQSSQPRKAIVWTATVHAAKDMTRVEADDRQRIPLGTYVRERFGEQSFVLGFSANSGSHSLGASARTFVLAPATPDSLEAEAFANHTGDTRYLDGRQLRELGPRVARPLTYTSWMKAPWATVMDGLLIVREETPSRPTQL
ncbi:erythromycin esterase family protein [Corallococcus exiguus]|uniref:Erythromycin esterase n=1 Tax=Corallococcus exiguus TaxID=83462 RepID=A0A7X4YH47_9BACT|nr:erythromycin esterase family protein [Corallococcus exiguus]NBC44569.1 erythromycin esterase [Corallococcus exiguus]TNV67185.1 erythromycin esterase [Corallococcus exiguus]